MWLLFHMLALQSQELSSGHPFMASTWEVVINSLLIFADSGVEGVIFVDVING